MVAVYIALLSKQVAGINTVDDIPHLWRDQVIEVLEAEKANLK